MIARRIENGLLVPVVGEVLLLAGVPFAFRQQAMATSLRLGDRGALSHSTAAVIHGFEDFENPVIIEASVTTDIRCAEPWLDVHRVRVLDDCDLELAAGLRVTTPARTLFDLAGRVDEIALEHSLDFVLRRRLATLPRLHWTVDRLGRRGRAGSALLRSLLEARDPSEPVPESKLERLLLRVISEAGLKRPQLQYEVRQGGRFVARVDFAYPDVKLAIEADGRDWHYGHSRWEQDLRRRSRLSAAGWRVIHITWRRLKEDPEGVVAEITQALLAIPPP